MVSFPEGMRALKKKTRNERLRASVERAAGFSLVEVLVALFMAALVFLMIAHMLGIGVEANRAASDTTRSGALAGNRLEELTRLDYDALAPGGGLLADVGGFFDTVDINADGVNDYVRRWEITDLGAEKRIRVRVISLVDVLGPPKDATYVTLVADR